MKDKLTAFEKSLGAYSKEGVDFFLEKTLSSMKSLYKLPESDRATASFPYIARECCVYNPTWDTPRGRSNPKISEFRLTPCNKYLTSEGNKLNITACRSSVLGTAYLSTNIAVLVLGITNYPLELVVLYLRQLKSQLNCISNTSLVSAYDILYVHSHIMKELAGTRRFTPQDTGSFSRTVRSAIVYYFKVNVDKKEDLLKDSVRLRFSTLVKNICFIKSSLLNTRVDRKEIDHITKSILSQLD